MLSSALLLMILMTTNAYAAPQGAGEGKRLIQLDDSQPPQWMSEPEVSQLRVSNQGFMDVTWTHNLKARRGIEKLQSIPAEPTQLASVKRILQQANTELMRTVLPRLTQFHNRYYRSPTGVESSDYLLEQINAVAQENNRANLKISVRQFTHPKWPQKSIIARIEGTGNNQETVIVGAHLDSINQDDPMNGEAPGAQDNGGGCVVILEAFRLIVAAGFQPKRPIEFHWYAAEEDGLLGSQGIVSDYVAARRTVAGMMQIDLAMDPHKTNPDIGVVGDYADARLGAFMQKLAPVYTKYKANMFKCGYGCSDHASWTKSGFPAIYVAGGSVRDKSRIHSPRDTLEFINYDHGLEVTKMAVAFAVELSSAV